MGLSTQEQMLIEQRVTNDAKSIGVAYLLWFFLGPFGAHRFYLGKTGSALAQMALTIVGVLTLFVVVGSVLLIIVGIWLIVDAFLIPGIIQQHKDTIREGLTTRALVAATPQP